MNQNLYSIYICFVKDKRTLKMKTNILCIYDECFGDWRALGSLYKCDEIIHKYADKRKLPKI